LYSLAKVREKVLGVKRCPGLGGEGPFAVQDLWARAVQAHHVVPARVIGRQLAVVASQPPNGHGRSVRISLLLGRPAISTIGKPEVRLISQRPAAGRVTNVNSIHGPDPGRIRADHDPPDQQRGSALRR
jgi:hypothetical protein